MTDLHARLLRWFEPGLGGDLEDAIAHGEAALRAVVELHAPVPCPGVPCFHLDPHDVCKTCGGSAFYVIGKPDSTALCSTITTIAEQLGIETGDHR